MTEEAEGELRRRIAIHDSGIETMSDPETGEEWSYRGLIATALSHDGMTEHGLTLTIATDSPDEMVEHWQRLARLSLYHQMNDAGAWRKPIDTTNRFMVGSNGDMIAAMTYQNGHRMTKDEALTFAAWLVMCADYGETDQFNEILNAIKET